MCSTQACSVKTWVMRRNTDEGFRGAKQGGVSVFDDKGGLRRERRRYVHEETASDSSLRHSQEPGECALHQQDSCQGEMPQGGPARA